SSEWDERKVSLYAQRDGQWVYVGGEGRHGSVTAKISGASRYRLFYNPSHVILPVKIQLDQNFPNPFNPTTSIRFGLPQDGHIRVTVYNILGQFIAELLNENRTAGYHNVIWNGRNATNQQVSSGIYLYRLETSQGVITRKMMLLK
ncbi:MAG TPA: T9SS type A sorting domain-containing protein, partial [bacterium]|nr:T9SS type A sorting domain-containing protein [bacterium]